VSAAATAAARVAACAVAPYETDDTMAIPRPMITLLTLPREPCIATSSKRDVEISCVELAGARHVCQRVCLMSLPDVLAEFVDVPIPKRSDARTRVRLSFGLALGR